MAVYTRYSRVLDAEGKVVTVREALTLINQILDGVLANRKEALTLIHAARLVRTVWF